MSLESNAERAADNSDELLERVDSLEYSIEVLAAAMRDAGVFTDENIRRGHELIRKENEEKWKWNQQKKELVNQLGGHWGSFLDNF